QLVANPKIVLNEDNLEFCLDVPDGWAYYVMDVDKNRIEESYEKANKTFYKFKSQKINHLRHFYVKSSLVETEEFGSRDSPSETCSDRLEESATQNIIEDVNKSKTENVDSFFPNQPVNIKTPLDHNNRRFLLSWYSFYKWLEYDHKNDRAFCFCCIHFGSGEAKKDNFVTSGFKNWKHATERFKEHESSLFHKIADIKWLERRKNSKSVALLINDQHKAEIEFNRVNLSKIIKIVIFLAKQGIPFRGHSESLESSNRGN
ncbi:unnamed protein product, partial [Brachionus calyciflorus]